MKKYVSIRRVMIRVKKFHNVLFVILLLTYILSACGRDEKAVITEFGVDGYAYVAEELSWNGSSGTEGDSKVASSDTSKMFRNVSNLKVSDGYLYFNWYGSIRRLPIDGELNFSKAKWVLDGVSELCDYEIDSEQGICYFSRKVTSPLLGGDGSEGGTLYRRSADGTEIYRTEISGGTGTVWYGSCLVMDGEDRAYLLLENGIHVIDQSGREISLISTEDCKKQYYADEYTEEHLCSDAEGNVYYFLKSTWSYPCKMYALELGDEVQLSEAPGFSTVHNFINIGRSREGGLLVNDAQNGFLYRYGREDEDMERVLRWSDSDLLGGGVDEVAELSGDRLLVLAGPDYVGPEVQAYLLTRKKVEEIPRKEEVVFACLYPDQTMQKAVTEFNRENERYRVVIEQYGARYDERLRISQETLTRLNAAMVSSHPPDLIDMQWLDAGGYAENGALEDLFPYLDSSEVLNREDILENVLEGYTMGGKLICIPGQIDVRKYIGRTSQLKDIEGWSMESMKELAEKYPDKFVIYNGGYKEWIYGKYYDESARGVLLEEVCAPYYLEKFINEENWECSFDSEEFRSLLQWIKELPVDSVDNEESAYEDYYLNGEASAFEDYLLYPENYFFGFHGYGKKFDDMMGEEACILGYPTVDGTGTYGTSVQYAFGIVSGSANPDGAWAFMEAFLTGSNLYDPYSLSPIREGMYKALESAWETKYVNDANGEPMLDKISYEPTMRKELVDAVLEGIQTANFRPKTYEDDVIAIIAEEAQSYFKGQKEVEEVTAIIQNRVQVLLWERAK